MLEMLRRSRNDFDTFRQIITAKIDITATLLATVSRWFNNVEIVYPIAVMELGEAERRTLAGHIIDEMITAFDTALADIEKGDEGEEVISRAAKILDPLWRELSGIYATVLNAEYEAAIAETDPEEIRQMLEQTAEMMAEMSGEDIETIRAHMRSDENVRAKLRRFGVDPDTF